MEAINFLGDYIKWIALLITAGAACTVTYLSMKRGMSTDAASMNDCSVKIKNTIIGAVVGISISSIVVAIQKFYK